MYSLYESLLSGTELWQNDVYNFLPTYFDINGGATSAFIIAISVGIAMLAIFYGIFGMLFPKMGSNKIVWLVCLILSFVFTWIITDVSVIGNANDLTGIYESIDTQMADEVLPNCGGVQEQIDEAQDVQRSMVSELSDGCSLNYTLLISNSVIALLVYGLFSLGVKRFTKYSINVPC